MAILNNDKHSIGDLFSNRNPFIIPKHQRAYSWEEGEIESFCQDIQEVEDEYFFGGIVSVHEHTTNVTGRTYRVVDGQQRLATFTILLAVLRKAFQTLALQAKEEKDATTEETANSLAEDLYDNYLTYKNTRKKPPVREYRLTLSKVDRGYFSELLDEEDPEIRAESHRRLNQAWQSMNNHLIVPILKNSQIQVEKKLDQLLLLKEKLLEHSVVIHITCDELDEAYQLFEVLNDRGKELAIGDYLRSSTLEQLDNNTAYQDKASECWDEILAKKNSEKYIKIYLTSHLASIKKSNIHRQFQKAFFSNSDNKLEIKQQILNIRDMFEVYESISEGIFPYENSQTTSWEKNRLSILIHQLDHKLCIPFLLSLYECASETDFKNSILYIEKFVFRYITVSGLRANRLSDIYKKHILSMRRNNLFDINDFKLDLKNILNSQCKDQFFIEKIESGLSYKKNSKSIKKIRYFLTTLETYYSSYNRMDPTQALKPSMDIQYNIDSIDIEHVYPQNPKVKLTFLEPYTHDIGNLTFWSPNDNKAASNEEFSKKETYYKDSNIGLTRHLTIHSKWDVMEIENRKELYFDMAKKIFYID
ncbi:DUF262 domain-containing protein [Paenibacillus wenxiniae]|uniref:DUF262 domain-containing HNH endonuclease family protein n=1 Tax=Paenibacillus wenxiniae TaxID=1636843 RepID=A0ABW4RLI4_9BACL